MERGDTTKKTLGFLALTVLCGVAILVIEYHTGFFATRQSAEPRQLARDQRELFLYWMTEGSVAADQKKYSSAVWAYKKALEVYPDNPDAVDALRRSQDKQQEAQRKAEYASLLETGQAALTVQDYGAAVSAYKNALILFPNDSVATRAIQQTHVEEAKAVRARNLEECERHNLIGGKAMNNKRYREAMESYSKALAIVPDDPASMQGFKLADERYTKEQFDMYFSAGMTAIKAGNDPGAVEAFSKALALYPDGSSANKDLDFARFFLRYLDAVTQTETDMLDIRKDMADLKKRVEEVSGKEKP